MMNYGRMQECIWKQELRDMRHEIDTCNQKVEDVTVEYEKLKEEFKYSQQKLQSTEQALRDVTNKKHYWRKAERFPLIPLKPSMHC